MGYVGNSPTANFASVTKDLFSGDGSTTAFTLSKAATTNGVAVFVENVRQEPTIAYAVSGTTLTFTAAPVSSSGNNIYVLHHNAVASTANHPAGQDLTAVNGTFTGAFTSLGIDDNADATAITIDSSERIGIGTTSPAAPLHMDTGSTTDIMRFGSGGRWGFQIQNSDPRYVGLSRAMNGSSSPVLSIDGDTGHVGINTDTPDASYQLCVKESGAGVGIKLEPSGSGCESYIQLKFQNSSNTTRTAMVKGDNGDSLRIASADAIGIGMETSDSQALGIGSDGSLRLQHVYDDTTSNSANMYIHSDGTHQVMRSTSSERYKKNIETLEDKYADAVLGLRPVWYKSKCEADNADHSHWGLIAEEVAKVDPRLVTFRNEYTEDIGDGKWKVVKLDAPQAESVQYDRLVPHLINICKRQEDKITALEARIKALEEA